jgi:hypothetical protein
MTLNEHDALNLITVALQSGSIQLVGNTNANTDESSESRGKRDAKYLASLLKGLVEAQ